MSVKDQYDKILLLVGVLTLAASAFFVFNGMNNGSNAGLHLKKTGSTPDLGSISKLAEKYEMLKTPYSVSTSNEFAFVSEFRIACTNVNRALIRPEEENCPFCHALVPRVRLTDDTDKDGMPDGWELQHGLDNVIDDAAYDKDGDGFTNLEEYTAGTLPNDMQNHPPLIIKQRVAGLMDRPLKFKLLNISKIGDTYKFQLYVNTPDPIVFAKLGETVGGWLVEAFDPESQTLTIRRGGDAVALKKFNEVVKNRRIAKIVDLTKLDSNGNDVFADSVINLADGQWKVIKITEQEVEVEGIHDEAKGQRLVIPRITNDEVDQAKSIMRSPDTLEPPAGGERGRPSRAAQPNFERGFLP